MHDPSVRCPVCGRTLPAEALVDGALVRPGVAALVRAEHPAWTPDDPICLEDLTDYRGRYVRALLEADKGELDALEAQVVDSIRRQELVAENVNEAFGERLTTGQRVADAVATFGGSWRFILGFGAFLLVWVGMNSVVLLVRPFDPYPFILLNLLLSCLAALQAPVIMMSQNRQEAKDRLRAQNDYRTNLKAELEVRLLHEKIDHLLTHQWQRLLEIQELQLEMLREGAARRSGAPGGGGGDERGGASG